MEKQNQIFITILLTLTLAFLSGCANNAGNSEPQIANNQEKSEPQACGDLLPNTVEIENLGLALTQFPDKNLIWKCQIGSNPAYELNLEIFTVANEIEDPVRPYSKQSSVFIQIFKYYQTEDPESSYASTIKELKYKTIISENTVGEKSTILLGIDDKYWVVAIKANYMIVIQADTGISKEKTEEIGKAVIEKIEKAEG